MLASQLPRPCILDGWLTDLAKHIVHCCTVACRRGARGTVKAKASIFTRRNPTPCRVSCGSRRAHACRPAVPLFHVVMRKVAFNASVPNAAIRTQCPFCCTREHHAAQVARSLPGPRRSLHRPSSILGERLTRPPVPVPLSLGRNRVRDVLL